MEKQKVYLVLFDYSTDDCSDVEIYLFDTYEKALNKMKEIIKQEKDSKYSCVANAFDKDDNLDNNYELDTNMDDTIHEEQELWWNITCKHDWYLHDFLDLRIKEIE